MAPEAHRAAPGERIVHRRKTGEDTALRDMAQRAAALESERAELRTGIAEFTGLLEEHTARHEDLRRERDAWRREAEESARGHHRHGLLAPAGPNEAGSIV